MESVSAVEMRATNQTLDTATLASYQTQVPPQRIHPRQVIRIIKERS